VESLATAKEVFGDCCGLFLLLSLTAALSSSASHPLLLSPRDCPFLPLLKTPIHPRCFFPFSGSVTSIVGAVEDVKEDEDEDADVIAIVSITEGTIVGSEDGSGSAVDVAVDSGLGDDNVSENTLTSDLMLFIVPLLLSLLIFVVGIVMLLELC
jgi:hypothetical protein